MEIASSKPALREGGSKQGRSGPLFPFVDICVRDPVYARTWICMGVGQRTDSRVMFRNAACHLGDKVSRCLDCQAREHRALHPLPSAPPVLGSRVHATIPRFLFLVWGEGGVSRD